MADNFETDAGSGGNTYRSDDVSGVHYPLVKLADGTAESTTVIAADEGGVANALRVVLPDDFADGTYIGDIKFGESLPAGTNAIGKLAANTGVDIGDVDVTSVAPGTGAANLGKAEDAAHTSGDVGVMALSVRQDTAAALGGTDADYQPMISDANGRLHVLDANSASIKTAAEAVQTAAEIMDDWDDGSDHCAIAGAAAEDAAVAGAPVLTGGRYDSTERTLDNGDAGALALSAQGWAMVGQQSSYIFDGATRVQVKRASGLAATGTVAMVAAVAGYQIRVLALALFATAATVTNVYVHNDDNDILGDSSNPIPLATDADGDNIPGFVLPFNPGGWFQTDTDNEALNVTLSAAQDVIYCLTYVEVT